MQIHEIVRLFTQMNTYFLVMNSKRCINEIEQKQNMDEGLRNSKHWLTWHDTQILITGVSNMIWRLAFDVW